MSAVLQVYLFRMLERIAADPQTFKKLNASEISAIGILRGKGLIVRVGLEDFLTPQGKTVLESWEAAHEARTSMELRAHEARTRTSEHTLTMALPAANAPTKNGRTKLKLKLSTRFRILQRDHFRCQYCGRSPATDLGVRLQVDHRQSRANGGTHADDNLVTTCFECNNGKGSRSL